LSVDTLLDENRTSTHTLLQYEEVLRRADVVVSTRLHGMVFALKVGTPVVAIDPVAGGAKVSAQAAALNWPHVLDGDSVEVEDIHRHVGACLSAGIDETITRVRKAALLEIDIIRGRFERALSSGGERTEA
jgi:hypothetical protein